MAFVYDDKGRHHALSRLQSYANLTGGKSDLDFGPETGVVRATTSLLEEALASWVQAAFPAQPGTLLLSEITFLDGDEPPKSVEDEIAQETLIGWALPHAGGVLPITVEGVQEKYLAVLHPDGRVDTLVYGMHESFEAFVDFWRKSRSS